MYLQCICIWQVKINCLFHVIHACNCSVNQQYFLTCECSSQPSINQQYFLTCKCSSETSINQQYFLTCECLKWDLIIWPMFWVCDISKAASTSSRMYRGAGLNNSMARIKDRAISDLNTKQNNPWLHTGIIANIITNFWEIYNNKHTCKSYINNKQTQSPRLTSDPHWVHWVTPSTRHQTRPWPPDRLGQTDPQGETTWP